MTTDSAAPNLAELESATGVDTAPRTVRQLVDAFCADAEATRRYAVRRGEPNNELKNIRDAARALTLLYGDRPLEDFGPIQLRAVRRHLSREGYCTSTINGRLNRIRRIWRFAVELGYVAETHAGALRHVRPAKPGDEGAARQPSSRDTVPWPRIEATLPHLSDVVATIVELLYVTGARPGEICSLRGEWIDRDAGDVWQARLPVHKNAWRNEERVLLFGRRCQELLEPYLQPGPIFRTRQGTPWRTQSLGQAVRRACDAGGLPRWSPQQIRREAATLASERAGLHVAQELLGHADARTTQRYIRRRLVHSAEYQRRYGAEPPRAAATPAPAPG